MSSVHRNSILAAEAAISAENRSNDLGAPSIVNFGFSIELFIKLLGFLSTDETMHGQDLYELFKKLQHEQPSVADRVIERHFYINGEHGEFAEEMKDVAKVFEDWRYAYERPFLCTSTGSLIVLADAFRTTVAELHPELRSAFRTTQEAPSPQSEE